MAGSKFDYVIVRPTEGRISQGSEVVAEVKTKGRQGTDKSIVASGDFYVSLIARSDNPHAPWIAAHLAVLDQGAVDIRLQIDLHFFAAVRTGHQELFAHRAERV
jgi:hypothetical protein